MGLNDSERVRDLFDEARQLAPGARGGFLDVACGDDDALRRRVEALLAAQQNAAAFLADPTVSPGVLPRPVRGPASAVPQGELEAAHVGERLGHYKLLQLIGEGGFGAVYMAEQEQPVRRRVAVKVLKPGMDSKQVVARFEAERQALAMMDHHNIAKVFDAGASATGRPYFVMELVRGVPITQYCDDNHLTPRERLELFIPVCNAVQHAHQKGIIHRDLKPSNVLVTLHDGRPVPKVIDFGIAKATEVRLTERTLFTEFRQFVGTPQYMSPEQAEMTALDVDTRSDVYSLGVMLYELLVGTTPFDARELLSKAYAEMQRIIREVDPPKPSTRLSSIGAALTTVAQSRRTEPRRLATLVRGELDWIVMKCLEKDRRRRYESASELAADLRRQLTDEAVLAGPPSVTYRLTKLVRRHRRTAIATAAVAASLVLGLTAATVGFVQARAQRNAAVAARADEARQRVLAEEQSALARRNADAANAEAAKARAVNEFLQDLLASGDPNNANPGDYTVRQALDSAAQWLDGPGGTGGALTDQPLVEAAVRQTLGAAYRGLGRFAESESQLRRAMNAIQGRLPAGHPDLAHAQGELGLTLYRKGDYASAGPLLRDAVAAVRAWVLRGDAHPDALPTVLGNYGLFLEAIGDLDAAESAFRESLRLRMGRPNGSDQRFASSLNNLAYLLVAKHDLAAAEPIYRETVDTMRRTGGDRHPGLATALNNYGLLLQQKGDLPSAQAKFDEALATQRLIFGDGHPDEGPILFNLAAVQEAQGAFADAVETYRQALAIARKTLAPAHRGTVKTLVALGALLVKTGDLNKAEPLLLEAASRFDQLPPAAEPLRERGRAALFALYSARGDPANAAKWKAHTKATTTPTPATNQAG